MLDRGSRWVNLWLTSSPCKQQRMIACSDGFQPAVSCCSFPLDHMRSGLLTQASGEGRTEAFVGER